MGVFHTASDNQIKSGLTTDVYFIRTKKILDAKGLSGVPVVAEVTTGELPRDWAWGVLCGIEEVCHLLEGTPVNVYSMAEGTLFRPADSRGVREPVMFIEGAYGDFGIYETALLGLLCQSSGIATAAARIKKIAGDRPVASFGIRRMHPGVSPMIDRAAYIGGFDGVSGLAGAELIGIEPSGTMPHALIILFGDQVAAWKAFDEVLPSGIPRIALVDTYYDEKVEAVLAGESLGDHLSAVRLDTPSSRRGDFSKILREVRWELDIRGYKDVKIFVSGGIGEEEVRRLRDAGADAFGIGTSVSNAPTIDFALDIVEVRGKPAAKRGKLGGRKQVWRCPECFEDVVLPHGEDGGVCERCQRDRIALLQPILREGRVVYDLRSAAEIRSSVMEQVSRVEL